jgi:WD40 repeat protein
MTEEMSNVGKLNVFISYSRDDLDFADQLSAALGLHDFDISLDRLSVSGGEDWKLRLGGLILGADTVVFVLSPASASSKICQWEVEEATKLGKRIIPVVCRALDNAVPPSQLANLNYILFYADPRTPRSGFGSGLARLVVALHTDLDWLREHTRLLQRATEWDAGGRLANRLLSGNDIGLARLWAARRPKEAPAPTDLQLDFIRASETWEAEQQNAERQRLQQIAEAQEAREAALRDKEASQKREAEALKRETDLAKRFARRTLAGLAVALALAVLAGGFGFYALQQSKIAERQTAAAVTARNEALRTESKFLTDQAHREIDAGDATNGLLLALEALPDPDSDKESQRTRPFWPPAQVALDSALRAIKERLILRGHTGPVFSVAVTPDGARIVSGSRDRSVRVWDARTGTELAVLKGHIAWISSVALTSDGARIVTGSGDGTARIWDAATGAELAVLKGHVGEISGVAVTPDGARIITSSKDKTVKVWDAKTGAELGTLRGHTAEVSSVAVSPDGRRIVTGSYDGTVRIWDSKTGAELSVLQGHGSEVTSVCITPDGSRIVSGSADGTAQLWDLDTSAELLTLKGAATVRSVTVSPDASTIIIGSATDSGDGVVSLWDAKTGQELARRRIRAAGVLSVAVTPDGAHLVSGYSDGTIRIWDANPDTGAVRLQGHAAAITALAVTLDSTRIVTGSEDGTARIWQIKTGAELAVLKGHTGPVLSVAVTPDGARIVTASEDKTARIWDAKTGAQLAVLTDPIPAATVTRLAVTPDGTRVITGGLGIARIWDVKTGAQLVELNPHGGLVTSIAVTPDSSRTVIGYANNIARIWDNKTGAVLTELSGHNFPVLDVAVFPDGSRVITTSQDTTARIWDAQTGAELLVLRGHSNGNAVNGVAVTSDGKRVVTSSLDGTARVWDAQTGAQLLVLKGHTAELIGVAVTPDGKRVVTASLDETARVWDLDTGAQLALLEGHTQGLSSLAVSPDDEHIITGSLDSTVRIWDLLPTGTGLVNRAKNTTPRCLSALDRESYNLSPDIPHWCGKASKWPVTVDAFGAISEGRQLIAEGKDAQADSVFALAIAQYPRATESINSAWGDAYLIRGVQLLFEAPDSASIQFEKALARDPSLDAAIELARGAAQPARAFQLVDKGELPEAKVLAETMIKTDNLISKLFYVFAAAHYFISFEAASFDPENKKRMEFYDSLLVRDPSAVAHVVEALFHLGFDLDVIASGTRRDRAPQDSPEEAIASRAYERAMAWAQRENITVPASIVADAHLARGRVFYSQKRYAEAVDEFQGARRSTETDRLTFASSGEWLWWARNGVADQLSAHGNAAQGLLTRWTNLLGLESDVRETLGPRNLKDSRLWHEIALIHADLTEVSATREITECDRLASFNFDPYRVSAGVELNALDAPRAVAACNEAVTIHPDVPRLRYLRGRAYFRAAVLASAANDETIARADYASALTDYEAAMAADYPAAFNNIGFMLTNGQGATRDLDKASDFNLQTLNRVIYCCALPAARRLLGEEAKYDVRDVHRVCRELLRWAAALGSADARQTLTELVSSGTLEATDMPSPAQFTDLPPWFKE